ncbi:MAG: hypothetical protein WCT04_09025 [Planctomycetota bacterium]
MIKPLPSISRVALSVALAIFLVHSCCSYRVEAGESNASPAPAAAGAPKPAKPSGDAPTPADLMSGMDWSATKQSFLDEKGAVVLSGSAYVRYQGIKLQADNIVFYRETREMYAEGHCRMAIGESEMEAAAAYIDVDSNSGYLIEAVVKVTTQPNVIGSSSSKAFGIRENPVIPGTQTNMSPNKHTRLPGEDASYVRKDPYGTYVDASSDPQARVSFLMKADKVILQSKLHFTTENAFITNDEMAHPIYGMKAAAMDFYLHEIPDPKNPGKTMLSPEKVVLQKPRLQVFGHDLLPFPNVTYDMANRREYISIHQGQSGRWGNYLLTRFGYDMGPAKGEIQQRDFQFTHVYVDLDERMRRGPAAGFELEWQTKGYQTPGAGPEKLYYDYGVGRVRAYGEYEIQIKTEDDIGRASRDLERRIQPKIDGFQRIQFDPNLLFLARRKVDNAGPPSFAIDKHEGEVRGLLEIQQHIPIKRIFGVQDVQVDLVYERESDRDFNLEFFPQNYNRHNQSEAMASVRKACDDWNFEFLYRTNPENFDSSPPRSPFDYGTFTGYEPAATYTSLAKDVGLGVYMSGEAQAARMKKYFERAIYNQPNLDSDRLYGKVDFARPTQAFCFLNITPHIGAQGMLYDNSRDVPGGFVGQNSINGNSISQGAITYGLDLDTRIYGTFCELKNEALGIDGLRHVVEPKFSFRGVSNTVNDPVKIFDFDQIDDLQRQNVATFSLEQTFQTHVENREGQQKTVTVGGFDTSLDYYPSDTDRQRLLGGNSFGMLRVDGFLRVLDIMRFDAGVGLNPQNFQVETAQWKVTVDPHDRWRVQFSERFNFSKDSRAITGSDQYHLEVAYELSDRWALSYEQILEKKKSLQLIKGRQVERIGLTRHYGPFDASIFYSVDRNINDHGFYGSLRPTVVSRNLILAENDPLVNPVTVGGEFEEPEARNFDPMQILKQQRLNKKGGKSLPGEKGSGGDVPAPPQTSALNRSKNNELADTIDLDKIPKSKPAQKKAAVDADEWTLPASVPTSARDR